MHESGIVLSLIAAAEDHLPQEPGARVRRVAVRIGELSGISAEAFGFAFECLSRGTRLEGARLDLETVPLTVECEECGQRNPVEGLVPRCPACGSSRTRIATGREIELRGLEVEVP